MSDNVTVVKFIILVHPVLVELHVKLLRRIHKKLSNVTADRWEKGIVKVRAFEKN